MVLPTMAREVFGASLVFVWNGARGERFNFCFSRVSDSIGKAFILAGGGGGGTGHWVLIYSMEYGHFPHIS